MGSPKKHSWKALRIASTNTVCSFSPQRSCRLTLPASVSSTLRCALLILRLFQDALSKKTADYKELMYKQLSMFNVALHFALPLLPTLAVILYLAQMLEVSLLFWIYYEFFSSPAFFGCYFSLASAMSYIHIETTTEHEALQQGIIDVVTKCFMKEIIRILIEVRKAAEWWIGASCVITQPYRANWINILFSYIFNPIAQHRDGLFWYGIR